MKNTDTIPSRIHSRTVPACLYSVSVFLGYHGCLSAVKMWHKPKLAKYSHRASDQGQKYESWIWCPYIKDNCLMLSSTMSLSTEVLTWIQLCQHKKVRYQAEPL